jgi:hypothetical protein
MNESSHCCSGFERLVRNAGTKGYSVVTVDDGSDRYFDLQARPFESSVSDYLNSIDPNTGVVRWPEIRDSNGRAVPWVSIIHLRLRYCPFCGRKLVALD